MELRDHLGIFLPPTNRMLHAFIAEAQYNIVISRQTIPNINFCNALLSAQKRGVRIRVLLSSPTYFNAYTVAKILKRYDIPEAVIRYTQGSVPEKEHFIRVLKKNAIDVRYINHERFFLNHSKYMIVDSQRLYLGSAPNDATGRLDIGIFSHNTLYVKNLMRLFEADFHDDSFEITPCNGLAIAPNNMRQQIEHLLNRAEKSISMMFPVITNDRHIFRILRAKIKSGVDVRALCSPEIFSEDRARNPNYTDLKELIKMGVQIRESYTPVIHCRNIIVDADTQGSGSIFIGSGHLKTHSLDYSREVGVILTQEDIVTQLKGIFLELWNKSRVAQSTTH